MKNKSKSKKIIDRNKYIESVYHIVFMGNIARNFNATLSSVAERLNESEKMTIRYSIQWNVMVTTISLLDEINNYLFLFGKSNLADKATKEKINSYKYIINPIVSEIDKWTDFRRFRNNVLAHNFRIDSDNFKSVHLSNELHKYNAPESTIDLITLFKYIDSITKIAEEMFSFEYQEAKSIIDSFNNSKKRLSTPEEGISKVNNSLAEVNKRIFEYNEKLRNEP